MATAAASMLEQESGNESEGEHKASKSEEEWRIYVFVRYLPCLQDESLEH